MELKILLSIYVFRTIPPPIVCMGEYDLITNLSSKQTGISDSNLKIRFPFWAFLNFLIFYNCPCKNFTSPKVQPYTLLIS